jgi:hypothetical protein
MQKCLIFLLTLISLSVQARANWNPYSMDHERFVHLTDVEKRAVVVKTMELIVEMESNYEKEVTTSGYSSQRLEKFVRALTKLQDLIISNATAAEVDTLLPKLAGEFGALLSRLGKNGCIYGGYISKVAVSNGTKYCRHPSTMKSTNPEEALIRKAYQSKNNTCKGPDKISCNPVIFGYETKGSTTPFCVETGLLKSQKAHNVAYNCMKKSLGGTPKEVEDRQNTVSDAMVDNKAAFDKVHTFIFRTCACGAKEIDEDYAKYIKPHRTCYGMMNTLRELKNNECSKLDNVNATEFPDQWSRYFSKQATFEKLKPEFHGDWDAAYKNLIDKDAVKAICAGDPITPPIKPVVPVLEVPKPEWFCKTKCAVKEDKAAKEGDVPKVVCTIVKAGWNTVINGKTEFKDASEELMSKEIIVDDAKAEIAAIGMKDEKKPKQNCPVALEPVVAAKTCTIAVVDAEDPKKVTATVTFQGLGDKEVPEYAWTGGTATKDKPEKIIVDKTAEEQKVSVAFKITGAKAVEGEKPLSCEGVVPKLGEEAKADYKIDSSADPLKTPQDPSVKVHAKLTLDGKEITVKEAEAQGYYVSWTLTGASAPKPKAAVKVKDEATVASGNSEPVIEEDKNNKNKKQKKDKKDDTKEEKKEDVPVDAKKEEGVAGEVEKGESYDGVRNTGAGATKYDACASLIKKDTGKPVVGPSCQPIPPLAGPSYIPPNSNQNGPAQFFGVPERHAPAGGIL